MGHVLEEHTGEVRVRLRAPDLPGLLSEAAHALAELQAERQPARLGEPEPIRVEARDAEGLLVGLLDELIFRSDVEGRVYPALEVARLDGGTLEGAVRGGTPLAWKTAVKAATFHDLRIRRTDGELEARVVLDV